MNLYTFKPGDLIVSSQINANFQEFVRVLGASSTAAELALPGRLVLGSSNRASFSVLTDKVNVSEKYLHVGWNAEEYIENAAVRTQRRLENNASAAMRIGTNGVDIFYADASTSIASMPKVFGVNASEAYLHEKWSFTSRTPQSISDYRLMFTPLSASVTVQDVKTVADKAPARTIDLSSFTQKFGTSNYHGVEVSITATAAAGAGTEVRVHGQGLDPYTGLVLNLGSSQKDSTRGCVIFKRGASANQSLVISNTGGLSSLLITVVGLWK